MRLSLVVAVARNGVIGRDGALAWRISDDLKRFKQLTTGHPIIMGRKTFDSIGAPLPNRTNIVVSRTMAPREGVLVAGGVEEAIELATRRAKALQVDEVFVIGGAEIYRAALPFAHRIHLTDVDAEIDGDVRFPDYRPEEWRKTEVGGAEKSDRNEFACRYFILDRARPPEIAEKPRESRP